MNPKPFTRVGISGWQEAVVSMLRSPITGLKFQNPFWQKVCAAILPKNSSRHTANAPNGAGFVRFKIWNLFPLFLCVHFLIGCTSTIIPKSVTDEQVSFDSNQQNGGFLGYTSEHYGVLTPRARERYNDLVAKGYGTNFSPALTKPDEGLQPWTNQTWLITKEHLVKFGVMNNARKSGR